MPSREVSTSQPRSGGFGQLKAYVPTVGISSEQPSLSSELRLSFGLHASITRYPERWDADGFPTLPRATTGSIALVPLFRHLSSPQAFSLKPRELTCRKKKMALVLLSADYIRVLVASRRRFIHHERGHTMPGPANIVTYIILGGFALALIIWAMMSAGYSPPGQ